MDLSKLNDIHNFITLFHTSFVELGMTTVLEVAIDPIGRQALLFRATEMPGVGQSNDQWQGSLENLREAIEKATLSPKDNGQRLDVLLDNGTTDIYDNDMARINPKENEGPQPGTVTFRIPATWIEILKPITSEAGARNLVLAPSSPIFLVGYMNGKKVMIVITDSLIAIQSPDGPGFPNADGTIDKLNGRWAHEKIAPYLAEAIESNTVVAKVPLKDEEPLLIPIDLARKIYKLVT